MDREILLTYHRARYYDANLGRFTSRDPIGIQDDINLYTYTGNNPVNYVDRMGREKKLLSIIYFPVLETIVFKTYQQYLSDRIERHFILDNVGEAIVGRHYIEERNRNLIKFDSYEEMIKLGYKKQPSIVNKYHISGKPNNTKYIPDNKHQEAIYDSINNEFDYSDLNGATYNYGTNIFTHTILDAAPYIILGNSPNDPSNIIDRIKLTFE